VVTINAPLHPETEHLFDDKMLGRMKRGAYLINTARGKIATAARSSELCSRVSLLATRATYVSATRPGAPWRTMPHQGMTPHTSGTSLSAQARYAAGTREFWNATSRQADPQRVPDRR